ncbi:Hypothetical protein A7982_10559 [Minicystis rosea]|nr:Hypothetical protein A7982_10559 [Minicystis rosea]
MTRRASFRRGERLLVGFALGAASALIAYAIVRGVERAFFPEPNPAILIWSDRSPLVWRMAAAVYVGGASVFGGHALAARDARAAARWVTAAIVIATVSIVLLSVIAP